MTQPLSPSTFTFEEALAAITAAQTALAAQNTIASTVASMSTAVIEAREAAAEYAQALILSLWASVDPYDGRAVQAFTEQAARHLAAAQTATARSAAAGQAQILAAIGVRVPGVATNPVDVRAPAVDIEGGRLVLTQPDRVRVDYQVRKPSVISAEDMTTEAVFNRPARTFRALKAEGASTEDADEGARERITLLVDDNVMLAQRFAESEIVQNAVNLDETVIGYRRVIHPELSRTGVCGLCIAAADRIYQAGTLLPIHANCKCTIAAVTEDHDPGSDVNAVDLGALYRQGGGTSGAELKRVRYQVSEHGELGPTLAPKREYKPRRKSGRKTAAVS